MDRIMRITTITRSLDELDALVEKASAEEKNFGEEPRAVEKKLPRVRFDRWIAGLMLVASLPIIAMVWILVKITSRGPGFYSQRRTGKEGVPFRIHKIRTMTWNCESGTGAIWAAKNDPRVTLLGRFLRATHLDELPQLFNVVSGEMAMIGPRPERPEIIERLLPEIPNYQDRLAVLPGVTGLAQVCTGADQTIDDVRLKLEYDRLYIQRKTRWLDFRIALCTAFKMLHLNADWVRAFLLPESRLIKRQHAALSSDHIPATGRAHTKTTHI